MTSELRDWINCEITAYLPSDRICQGDKMMFRCPICGDSKKSITKKRGYYYLKTASFHCFNCDVTLSGMKLLQILSGEEYDDIKSRFFKTMFDGKHFDTMMSRSDAFVPAKDGNILQLKNTVKSEWKRPLSQRAREYLANRMVLSAPFLKEEFYSYISRNGCEYILIPWIINGIDAYFQLNDFLGVGGGNMKYVFPRNLDKLIYGLDNIDISFPYLICFEGVYDSLFVPNGIAIGGKNLTELQEKILKKRFPRHTIVFALDNDKPGLTATARTLDKADSGRMMYFKWFGCETKEKDINDLVKSRGDVNMFTDKDYVKSLIEDSITMKMWLVRNGYSAANNDKGKQSWKQGKVQPRPHGNVYAHASREVQRAI